MSSTRFNPPVPTFEEINPDTGARTADDDGFIVPGENDYAGPTNRRNLGSYLSSLTRGEVPTEGIVEYNGPVPTHGNAYPIGDASGNPNFTFTELGIEGGGVNRLDNYSNSGLFDGAVTDKNLSDVINKGKLGIGHGQETLSGHLLLPGIGSIRPSVGGKSYQEIMPEILNDANRNDPGKYAVREENGVPVLPSSRVKISSGDPVSFPSKSPGPSAVTASIESLSKVAADIMLRSTGKDKGPSNYGEFTSGFVASTVQIGTGRVASEDLRPRNYSAVSGLNSIVDGIEQLPTSDGVGETRYSDKSYGNTYNYLENFTDLNSGLTAFAAVAAAALAATLAVFGIFSIPGVGSAVKFPTYENIRNGQMTLTPGSFAGVGGPPVKLPPFLNKLLELAKTAGVETDIASLLNFYKPMNSLADYGQCVIIGFASFIGAALDDDAILSGGDNGEPIKLQSIRVRQLLGDIGLRFLAIALTSEKGYYFNIFREIMKDTGALFSNFSDVGVSSLVSTIANAKVVRFVDTLARMGDLVIRQMYANRTYKFNATSPSDPYKDGFNFDATKSGDEAKLQPAKRFANRRIRGEHIGSKRSNLGVGDLPSAHLVPKTYNFIPGNKLTSFQPVTGSNGRTNLRLSKDDVARTEDVLNAEYMPFYFHDLRTNEIIAFHAFLEELSDSYSAEYNSTSGYGRIEDVRMYKSTKRSVGCSFQIVATNSEDFDYMWWQINKLTTMVYPQWSQGRKIIGEDNFKFTQPFSQVPNATPVIRVRVGDLIRSNYSRFNLKRIFGYMDADKDQQNATALEARYYIKNFAFTEDEPTVPISTWPSEVVDGSPEYVMENFDGDLGERIELLKTSVDSGFEGYNVWEVKGDAIGRRVIIPDTIVETALVPADRPNIETGKMNATDFYDYEKNSVVKSFESTMGMGMAAVVTQLQFTWMDGLWGAGEDGAGHRAPRSCKVQMSFEPIHDIAPGLDHEGLNRAPIYPVGNLVNHLVEEGAGRAEPYGRFSKSSIFKST